MVIQHLEEKTAENTTFDPDAQLVPSPVSQRPDAAWRQRHWATIAVWVRASRSAWGACALGFGDGWGPMPGRSMDIKLNVTNEMLDAVI